MYGVNYKRHIRDMQKLRDASLAAGAYSAAVQAEKNRGLAEGLYVSKSEIRTGSIDQMSRADVEKELERIRENFEPVINITPTKVEEPDAASGPEESGGGVMENDITRVELNEQKN